MSAATLTGIMSVHRRPLQLQTNSRMMMTMKGPTTMYTCPPSTLNLKYSKNTIPLQPLMRLKHKSLLTMCSIHSHYNYNEERFDIQQPTRCYKKNLRVLSLLLPIKKKENPPSCPIWVYYMDELKKSAVALASMLSLSLLLSLSSLLLMLPRHPSWAASGGHMGGWSSSSSPSSSSSSSSSSWSSSSSSSSWSDDDDDYSYSPSWSSSQSSPPSSPSSSSSPMSNIILLLSYIMLAALILYVVAGYLRRVGLEKKTSVLQLQVGLLGLAKSLQRELNQIAETCHTSTPEDLYHVLTKTTQALLRHPDYCISAYSIADVKTSIEEGQVRFNQLSIEERAKFDEETLVNVNNIRRQRPSSPRDDGFNNEYIVVTILVAAQGDHTNLPTIKESKDLKDALEKLSSIPSSQIRGVEVLWTPQAENDTLSEKELYEDYPLLRPI